LFYNEPGGFYYPSADWSGDYTVTAIGCATVMSMDVGVTVTKQSCPGGNLLATVEIAKDPAPTGGPFTNRGALNFTKTTNGLKNLSMLMPGFPAVRVTQIGCMANKLLITFGRIALMTWLTALDLAVPRSAKSTTLLWF
jgi:hypothetical protein